LFVKLSAKFVRRPRLVLPAAFSCATFVTKFMADFVQFPVVASQGVAALDPPRHTVLIRLTHWINTISFLALLESGFAILQAQPALYWGETGFFGDPSLINLPILQNEHLSGTGRGLHFFAAWICVVNGGIYVLSGLLTHHFRRDMVPARSKLAWRPVLQMLLNQLRLKKPSEEQFHTYNVLQRLTYLAVIFLLFPLVILSGLAMSPAIVAVVPGLVEVFGGYQSARTIHFFVTILLVLFLIVHIAMVSLPGFFRRMRAMITGHNAA
jgi:thiosulfate reductase cytochrome b subunit